MNEKVAPLLVDGKEKQNLGRALTSPTTKRKKKSSARKRRTIDKCKWCGSKSHKIKRSKKCPFFGSTTGIVPVPQHVIGNDESPTVEVEADDVPPVVEVDDSPPVAEIDDTDTPTATEVVDDTPPVAEIGYSRPLFNIGDTTVLGMWARGPVVNGSGLILLGTKGENMVCIFQVMGKSNQKLTQRRSRRVLQVVVSLSVNVGT